MSITKFVRDHYTILYKGDQVDPSNLEEVDEFILADDHADFGTQLIHSIFLNSFFNKPKSTVYIESQPLGRLVNEEAKQVLWLDKDINAKGWDIGTIETIFAVGLVRAGAEIGMNRDEAKNLFLSLKGSKESLERHRLILKRFFDGQISPTEAKNELIKSLQKAQKIKFDDKMLFKIVDSTFSQRQNSLIQAWLQKGRKAFVVGELHLHKENENSSSLFDRDPKLKDGRAGRTLVQDFAKGRNAVVLRANPQISAVYFDRAFGPLMEEVTTFFANEGYTHEDIY